MGTGLGGACGMCGSGGGGGGGGGGSRREAGLAGPLSPSECESQALYRSSNSPGKDIGRQGWVPGGRSFRGSCLHPRHRRRGGLSSSPGIEEGPRLSQQCPLATELNIQATLMQCCRIRLSSRLVAMAAVVSLAALAALASLTAGRAAVRGIQQQTEHLMSE